jgi:2-C-methyl-D-erythritol 4-phosphate cytidylyltransferase
LLLNSTEIMNKYAVIVAGGSGSRMKLKLPKQFIELGSLPILMHTINCFKNYSENIKIILVLPENQIHIWKTLCTKYNFNQTNIQTVFGGNSRFQSCKNGINSITDEQALVAIHDGVRPFVDKLIITKGFQLAQEKGSAVCCIESKDSVRLIDENGGKNQQLSRSKVRLVQTPQVFQLKILKKAYATEELDTYTDDASVVEHAGYAIHLFEGDFKNIKITNPNDLLLAKMIFDKYKTH